MTSFVNTTLATTHTRCLGAATTSLGSSTTRRRTPRSVVSRAAVGLAVARGESFEDPGKALDERGEVKRQ
jgi:hypothetical protein